MAKIIKLRGSNLRIHGSRGGLFEGGGAFSRGGVIRGFTVFVITSFMIMVQGFKQCVHNCYTCFLQAFRHDTKGTRPIDMPCISCCCRLTFICNLSAVFHK